MEDAFQAEAKTMQELTLAEMEAGWQRVKLTERE